MEDAPFSSSYLQVQVLSNSYKFNKGFNRHGQHHSKVFMGGKMELKDLNRTKITEVGDHFGHTKALFKHAV